VKNEIPEDYIDQAANLKKIIEGSKLSQGNLRKVEFLLRDNGADYFKIHLYDGGELPYYTEYDLIWKYHGHGEEFIVYLDFD